MEILEADLIEQHYLKEGALTSFSGVPFGSEEPYSYFEAKRLLKLMMDELRGSRRLRGELGVDLNSPGRGAISGRYGTAVWDFLRLQAARGAPLFTKYPHLTMAIEHDRVLAMITVPDGVKTEFRRGLIDLGQDGFVQLMEKIDRNILAALRGDGGAAPMIITVQRRYPTQRSSAIVDAKVEFDLRTAFQHPRGSTPVKMQPQWLLATYDAIAKKRSNLQFAIGAAFPYERSSSVKDRSLIERVSEVWIACKPLINAMGVPSTRR